MTVSPVKTRQAIETVVIGSTKESGGTRSHAIKIGGQETMPFLGSRDKLPNPPVIAYEIHDIIPAAWNEFLGEPLSEYWNDPVAWARMLIEQCNAQLLFLKLAGSHPDSGARTTEETIRGFKRILAQIPLPMIVTGCGYEEIDRVLLPAAAEASSGENLLFATVTAENYRNLTHACIAHNHSVITESPIDINIAKQVNILVQDMGLPGNRIVMYATTGALGYGLEYAYSIMEKTRITGLEGDKYMNKPQAAFVGQETWRVREANTGSKSGIMWETITAQAYLHSGADIVVIRHPESGKKLQEYIEQMSEV